jgi:hypothetical protein
MTDKEFDEYEGRGFGFEIHHDLNRGTQLLEPDKQEIVSKARDALWDTLGILTCEKPPDELNEGDYEHLKAWLKHALYFRNVIRREFAIADGEMDPDTVH